MSLKSRLIESRNDILDWLKFQRYYGMFSPLGSSKNDQIPSVLRKKLEMAQKKFDAIDNLFSKPLAVMIISHYLPRFDKTSADYRLHNLLKILLANRCSVAYLYNGKTNKDQQYIKSFSGDISFNYHNADITTCIDFLHNTTFDHMWITSLWRLAYVIFVAELLQEIKRQKIDIHITVDTMDFHAKEYFRKYDWTKADNDLSRAQEFLALEKRIYPQADAVVTVSKEEANDIREGISNIKTINTIPNIHETFRSLQSFDERKHMCFVGHFGNQHNVDAVTYFLEKIFKSIQQEVPEAAFHVIGYGSDKLKNVFKGKNVRVIGSIKHIKRALACYKLFVCPMIYGAGMKGKIGLAIESGTPVVSTTIGAEGFPIRNGQHCFVTDVPEQFAKYCVQCLTDSETWYRLSVNATVMAAEHYSPGVVAQKLHSVLSDGKE
jgi:glycosyltransferase involved in cell wall biosynthesis